MALKFKFKTKEEIPAEHVGFYVEREGAWILDADGVVDKSKLDEFRNTNVALLKERDDLKKRFEGIDPDEVRRLAAEKEKLELQAKGHKPEEIEKLIEEKLGDARLEWEKEYALVVGERDSLNARLTSIQIDQGVTTTATKRGLRPTAIPDITSRARNVFRLVNGVPTAFEGDGKTVRYGKDGITPMTLEEWIDTQVSEAPHLFESNSGSGAGALPQGGGVRPGSSVKNPFKRETWNLTEQMKLQKTDPGLAARLKAAA